MYSLICVCTGDSAEQGSIAIYEDQGPVDGGDLVCLVSYVVCLAIQNLCLLVSSPYIAHRRSRPLLWMCNSLRVSGSCYVWEIDAAFVFSITDKKG